MNNDDPFFPLKSWDTSSSKKIQHSPEICIMKNGKMVVIQENDSVLCHVDDLPDDWNCFVPFKCLTCNHILILTTIVKWTETVKRSQGGEIHYTSTEFFNCAQCNQDIYIDILITYYVSNWFCVIECTDATPVWIDGFYWICDQLKQLELTKLNISSLKYYEATLLRRIKSLIEERAKYSSFILLVEGKDDIAIWRRWLNKEGLDHSTISIVKYGPGGQEEAIKAAKFFRAPGLKSIPHKVILDPDGKRDNLIKRLIKEEQLDKKSFHVLENKEIEAYLIEPRAIAKILSRDTNEVEAFIAKLRGGNGKEKLGKIFKEFDGPKVTTEMKETIVIHQSSIPFEINEILQEIRSKMNQDSIPDDFKE